MDVIWEIKEKNKEQQKIVYWKNKEIRFNK